MQWQDETPMDAAEERRFAQLDLAFRELYVRDLQHADAGDVRMGTFILCAAFLDALSLTYSAGIKVANGKRGKWARFMHDFLGEKYEPIWDSYDTFRNRLLHNYSATGIAFTHGAEQATLHLGPIQGGGVMLHRETFVRDVVSAFEEFAKAVRADGALRRRVFEHFKKYPPMGLVMVLTDLPED